MKILAVDTSTTSGSVALLDGSKVMVEWTLQSAQTHNRRLLSSIDSVLGELGWSLDQVEGFAVTTGPGSFTGLRIGLTTIKTLAWTLKKPYVGIPSLDALAAPLSFASLPVCTLVDAHRNEVYSAMFQSDGTGSMHRLVPYRVSSPEEFISQISGAAIFCGDGWLFHRSLLLEKLGTWAVEAPGPYHVVRAGFVGELARRKFLAGEEEDPVASTPLYIRPSEAELNNPQLAY
jgi:tRNA threonylcarbamoyladenosine biosynthesis protein TsaB